MGRSNAWEGMQHCKQLDLRFPHKHVRSAKFINLMANDVPQIGADTEGASRNSPYPLVFDLENYQ